MFTNKHVIIALIVAPILAILAWIAVGSLWGEKPQVAKPGESYPLVANSNCRYASGACDLSNNDIELNLRLDESAGTALLLSASHPIDSALMSVSYVGADSTPTVMQPADSEGFRWRLTLAAPPGVNQLVRLVVSIGNSAYFAEVPTTFTVED